MRTYHTMDKAEFLTLTHLFHPQLGAHYIDMPTGRILVATSFANEWNEEEFHTRAKTKKSLPHPVWDGPYVISPAHQVELRHFFTTDDEAKNATVHDVVRKAAAIHPLMRLSTL
jgi:hypothetical protein